MADFWTSGWLWGRGAGRAVFVQSVGNSACGCILITGSNGKDREACLSGLFLVASAELDLEKSAEVVQGDGGEEGTDQLTRAP